MSPAIDGEEAAMCRNPERKESLGGVVKRTAISRHEPLKPASRREGHQEILVVWVFHTCIRLQTSWDRHFSRLGLSWQEANALLCCVKSREITSGKLAIMLARDKG